MASAEGREALFLLRDLHNRDAVSSIVDATAEGPDGVTYDFGDGRRFSEHLQIPFHDAQGQPFALRALVLYYRADGKAKAYLKAMTSGAKQHSRRFVGINDKAELEKFMKGLPTPRVPEDASGGRDPVAKRRVQRFSIVSSSNVLSRAGHDFSLALDIMNSMKRDDERTRTRGPGGKGGEKRAHPGDERARHAAKKSRTDASGKHAQSRRKPIIMAPASRSALLQLINASSLLKDGEYKSARDMEKAGVKRPAAVAVTQPIDGHAIEFLILDAPHRMRESQWEDVVAVVVDGPAWQFKQYPDNPVDLFEKAVGVHFRFRDEDEPRTVRGWKVQRMALARSQRHGDRVVAAQFWRCVEQHIRLKRPEFLPSRRHHQLLHARSSG